MLSMSRKYDSISDAGECGGLLLYNKSPLEVCCTLGHFDGVRAGETTWIDMKTMIRHTPRHAANVNERDDSYFYCESVREQSHTGAQQCYLLSPEDMIRRTEGMRRTDRVPGRNDCYSLLSVSATALSSLLKLNRSAQ